MTAFGSVEIIDLSPESSTKASVMLPNYPLNVTGAVGTYLVAIDKAVVCGGTENLAGTFFSHCYEMDAQDREWTTSAPLGTMRCSSKESHQRTSLFVTVSLVSLCAAGPMQLGQ